MATHGNLTHTTSARLLWRAAAVLLLSVCAAALFTTLSDEPHAVNIVTFLPH